MMCGIDLGKCFPAKRRMRCSGSSLQQRGAGGEKRRGRFEDAAERVGGRAASIV